MFRAEINERQDIHSADFLDIAFVAFGNTVRESCCSEQKKINRTANADQRKCGRCKYDLLCFIKSDKFIKITRD